MVGREIGNSVAWVSSDGGDPDFGKVAIIDVIFTTGRTLKLGIHSLNEKGAKLVGAFVAIDRVKEARMNSKLTDLGIRCNH